MKVWVFKKSTLVFTALAAVLCVALGFFLIQLIPRAVSAAAGKRDLPIYSVDRTEKIASLSFDAAWGNEDTSKLIQILDQHHIHATFFVVGQWVDKYPGSVKELADAGNEVMNHSNTHPHMTKLSATDMQKQISDCDDKIEKITGKRPILFRAPYGDYDNTLIQTARGSGHYPIQWSVDRLDMKKMVPRREERSRHLLFASLSGILCKDIYSEV